jgi:hypothetical protein
VRAPCGPSCALQPYAINLEKAALPQVDDIVQAALVTVHRSKKAQ